MCSPPSSEFLGTWSFSRFVARRVRPDSQRYGACGMASSLFKSAWATLMSGTRTVTSISARTMARFICYPSLLSHFLGGRPRAGRCYEFLLNCPGALTQSCSSIEVFVGRWGPLRAAPLEDVEQIAERGKEDHRPDR